MVIRIKFAQLYCSELKRRVLNELISHSNQPS